MRRSLAIVAALFIVACRATAPDSLPERDAAHDGANLAPEARALWRKCVAEHALPVGAPLRVRRFGDTPEMNDRLLSLILSGEKTITATSPWLHEERPEGMPVAGGFTIVVDGAGTPRAVLRTTAVKTVRFDAVTADDSRYEGRPVRPLEAWREVHWAFFTRTLAPLGRKPSPDMPVTLERFALVCSAPMP